MFGSLKISFGRKIDGWMFDFGMILFIRSYYSLFKALWAYRAHHAHRFYECWVIASDHSGTKRFLVSSSVNKDKILALEAELKQQIAQQLKAPDSSRALCLSLNELPRYLRP
jgi:hypothetical protein